MARPAETTFFQPKKLTDAEQLKKNPLLHYDNDSTSLPTIPAPPSSRKPPRPKVLAYVAQPWVCPTEGQLIRDSKGKMEKRNLDFEAVFKNGEEWSFEEVRARERGLLGKEWRGAVKEWETSWHLPGCECSLPIIKCMLTISIDTESCSTGQESDVAYAHDQIGNSRR